jgi:hypothetical protein
VTEVVDKIWKFIVVTWDDKKVNKHEYRELKFEGKSAVVETPASRCVLVFLFIL